MPWWCQDLGSVLMVERMFNRALQWSKRKQVLVLLALAVAGVVIRLGVNAMTSSVVIRSVVSLLLSLVLGWALVLFVRVRLRAAEEEVKRNPRPW